MPVPPPKTVFYLSHSANIQENPPAVATGGVDGAVLAPHHKVVDVAQREGHGGDGHCLALFEHQLQTVLRGGLAASDSPTDQRCKQCICELTIPVAETACPGSTSTFCRQWKC